MTQPFALVYGLHLLDALVVVGSLVAVLVIGIVVSRGVKGESDFFVSGKSMGPWLTFFLNFGQATDSNGAPQVATEVYRQGIGGMWIAFQTLFITPFIWFTSVWFRRTRLITGPEMFIARFRSTGLASFYALFTLLTVPVGLGLGNLVSYKVAAAMMVKPPAEYTAYERSQVDQYAELEQLRAVQAKGGLTADERARYATLDSLAKRGKILNEISYIKEWPFYLVYTGIVAAYIMFGGIKAAAVTDAFQGLLIIIFSVMMIPLGLQRVGGFEGLHQRVPEHKFLLFGSPAMSEYTWYSIAAIVLASLVNFGAPGGPANAAVKDERTIRIGTLSGVFLKRFVMIAWAFCGLLAVALIPGEMADPDKAWGTLAKTLLFPGLMGLMISGMLLGHMPSVGVSAVSFSATFTRNFYEKLFTGLSPRHYMVVAQLSILGVLCLGILAATLFTGVIQLLSALIMFNAFFGTVGFLMYFWRGLTAQAVAIGAVVWLVMMSVVAFGLQYVPELARSERLLLQTTAQQVEVRLGATAADVAAGRATQVGQLIMTQRIIEPKPVFFEKIVLSDPNDPKSPLEGLGRFHVENFLIDSLGLPLEKFGPAGVTTCRWMFAAVAPFVMLVGLSYATGAWRRTAKDPVLQSAIDRFYARMKTPVNPDLAVDDREVAQSEANPTRFDHTKIFPKSRWEFTRWTRGDYLGFFGCWAGVGAILLMLWGFLRIGS